MSHPYCTGQGGGGDGGDGLHCVTRARDGGHGHDYTSLEQYTLFCIFLSAVEMQSKYLLKYCVKFILQPTDHNWSFVNKHKIR